MATEADMADADDDAFDHLRMQAKRHRERITMLEAQLTDAQACVACLAELYAEVCGSSGLCLAPLLEARINAALREVKP